MEGLYLKQPQVDKLPQQVCPVGRGGVPGQATQLLQELDQIIPPFRLHSQQDMLSILAEMHVTGSTSRSADLHCLQSQNWILRCADRHCF